MLIPYTAVALIVVIAAVRYCVGAFRQAAEWNRSVDALLDRYKHLTDHDSIQRLAHSSHRAATNPAMGLSVLAGDIDLDGSIYGFDLSTSSMHLYGASSSLYEASIGSFMPSGCTINPATGLPMLDGCIDVGGSLFGCDNSSAFSMDSCGMFSDFGGSTDLFSSTACSMGDL